MYVTPKQLPRKLKLIWFQMITVRSYLHDKEIEAYFNSPSKFKSMRDEYETFFDKFCISYGIIKPKLERAQYSNLNVAVRNLYDRSSQLRSLLFSRSLSADIQKLLYAFLTSRQYAKAKESLKSYLKQLTELYENQKASTIDELDWESVDRQWGLSKDYLIMLIQKQTTLEGIRKTAIKLPFYHNSRRMEVATAFLNTVLANLKLANAKRLYLRNEISTYWATLSNQTCETLIEGLPNQHLEYLAPYLKMTVKDIKDAGIELDIRQVRNLAKSDNKWHRKFWIVDKRVPTVPRLHKVAKDNYFKLSRTEQNILDEFLTHSKEYKSHLNILIDNRHTVELSNKLFIEEIQKQFLQECLTYSNRLDVEMLNPVMENGKLIIPYISIDSDLSSTRKDYEVLSYLSIDTETGVQLRWNPKPWEDECFNIQTKSATSFYNQVFK